MPSGDPKQAATNGFHPLTTGIPKCFMIACMAVIIQKYGGTSVASAERIDHVARRVAYTRQQGHQVVVVVSAMGHETDRLMSLALQVMPMGVLSSSCERELDMLLSTGEQVSIALLAMSLQKMGCPAVSMTGSQAGVLTNSDHTRARVLHIDTERILQHLGHHEVVIVAGFQGISSEREVTTLGRGGSDTTAVALAAALQADVCEIYTDVPGVFTTDPRKVDDARLLPHITSSEMLELASLGAQVLHPRSVEIARNFGVTLKVLSSLEPPEAPQSGTQVISPQPSLLPEGIEGNQAVDSVILDRNQVKVVFLHVPDRPGVAAQVFAAVAEAGINVDLILQSLYSSQSGRTNDIAFTIPQQYQAVMAGLAPQLAQKLGCPEVLMDADVAKISIGGAGMIGRPAIAADMFQVLAKAGINLQMISMSEIKISCVIDSAQAGDAALLLGEYFRVIPHSRRGDPLGAPGMEASGQSPSGANRPVRGVALDLNVCQMALVDVPDRPGAAADVFRPLAQANISVDMIIQSQRQQANGEGQPTNTIALMLSQAQMELAAAQLQQVTDQLGCAPPLLDSQIAKVSIVGSDMEAHPGVAAQMFATLAAAQINIEMIATSEIKVSCIVPKADGIRALQAIHAAFELGRP